MTGVFVCCHCGNTGVEQTPTKSQHRKLTLEKNVLPPLLSRLDLATFDQESGALPASNLLDVQEAN